MAGSRELFGASPAGHGGHFIGTGFCFAAKQPPSTSSTRPPHADTAAPAMPLGKKGLACSIFMSTNLPPFGPVASCTPHSPPSGEYKRSCLGIETARPFSRVNSWFGRDVPEMVDGTNCSPVDMALDTLALSGEEDACLQAAARSVANLALVPNVHKTLSKEGSLDVIAESMRTRSSECVGRFLAMALGRLAANKEAAQRILAHTSLLTSLVAVGQKAGGEWKQAARALSVLTKRAADADARALLLRLGAAGVVVRLTSVKQTELQLDALCGIAAWCHDVEGVVELAACGAWSAMLAATASSAGAAPTTGVLCAEVLQRALRTSLAHVTLGGADLARVAAEAAAGGLSAGTHAAVLCTVAELGRAGAAMALALSLKTKEGVKLDVRACVAFVDACLALRGHA